MRHIICNVRLRDFVIHTLRFIHVHCTSHAIELHHILVLTLYMYLQCTCRCTVCVHVLTSCCTKPKLSTHNLSVTIVPSIVTNRCPLSIQTHLQSSLSNILSFYQPDAASSTINCTDTNTCTLYMYVRTNLSYRLHVYTMYMYVHCS